MKACAVELVLKLEVLETLVCQERSKSLRQAWQVCVTCWLSSSWDSVSWNRPQVDSHRMRMLCLNLLRSCESSFQELMRVLGEWRLMQVFSSV